MDILITWLRSVAYPTTNIPTLICASKIVFIFKQFPLAINKDKFVVTNSNKYQSIVSTVVVLLHLGVVLNWLLEQLFSPVNPSPPIWKFVFSYYCITLFGACVLFLTQFTLLRVETIRLLNSGIHIEQTINSKGEYEKFRGERCYLLCQ